MLWLLAAHKLWITGICSFTPSNVLSFASNPITSRVNLKYESIMPLYKMVDGRYKVHIFMDNWQKTRKSDTEWHKIVGTF